MLDGLAQWWDGVELWFTQLWFPVQVGLLMVVLVPLCWWAARMIDSGFDRFASLLSREPRAGAEKTRPRR